MSIESVNNIAFEVSSKPIAVTKDTSYTLQNILSATEGGDVAGAFATMETRTTRFKLTNNNQSPLDMSKCALAVDLRSTNAARNGAMAANQCVPWNLFGNLIQSLRVRFNSANNDIISTAGNDFSYQFTAHMIHKYSWNVLNNHPAICSPIANDYIERYIGTAATLQDAAAIREQLYNNRFRLICPINDMLLGCPLFVLRNLRQLEIDITWSSVDMLKSEVAQNIDDDARGSVLIQRCEFLANSPVITAIQQQQSVIEKEAMKSDLIAWSVPFVNIKAASSADIILPSQKNVEKVVIMQYTNKIARADEGGIVALPSSSSQFHLFARTGLNRANDTPYFNATNNGLTNFQIQYSNITYPSLPIQIRRDTTNLAEELYYEYLKCCDVFGAKDSSPIPFTVFRNTMPFISLSWGTREGGAILDNSGKDVICRFRGDTLQNAQIAIIVFRYVILSLQADGTMKTITD